MISHSIFIDLKESWLHIKNKWTQTIISTLGIIVSICSIFIMLSVSEGSKQQTLEKLEDFGIDTIRITFNKDQAIKQNLYSKIQGISQTDIHYIKTLINKNDPLLLINQQENVNLTFKNQPFWAKLIYSNSDMISFENLHVKKGRNFFISDFHSTSLKALISEDIALALNIKVNERILVQNSLIDIIGIVSSNKAYQNFIIVNSINILQTKQYDKNAIFLKIKEAQDLLQIASTLKDYFSKKPHKDLYSIQVPLLEAKNNLQIQNNFNIAFLVIATMALLMGGIGIMNVMLSSISEQTREIGLKLVLGATQNRLRQYYLIYSTIICTIGGVLGLILSAFIFFVLHVTTTIPITLSWSGLFGGFLVSILTGVCFGIYPAIRASSIEPSVAIREY